MGTKAKASAQVEFRPKINFAEHYSKVAGDDQATGSSVLLDDSRIKQKQRFSESGEGDQYIKQKEVQEDVADA